MHESCMGSVALICSVLFLSFQFGCAGAAGQPAAAAPDGGAQLVSISPNAVPVGQAAVVCTVQGMNFSSQSTIKLNGAEQKTAFVSSEAIDHADSHPGCGTSFHGARGC